MKKLVSFISGIAVAIILVLAASSYAEEDKNWEKWTVEENLYSIEAWAKKWPHVDDNVSLENRLISGQLWVDIQIYKELKKLNGNLESGENKGVKESTKVPLNGDWTGMGGISNTE